MGKALEPTLNTAQNAPEPASGVNEDYSRAIASARIACYDDFRSAPRVTEIAPTTTAEFIENLASTIYTQAQQAGADLVSQDAAKMPELLALLQKYGAQAITQLKPEQLGAFATELRGLGAKL